MLLFLVTPSLVVAVEPCMEWIPILKKSIPSYFCVFGFSDDDIDIKDLVICLQNNFKGILF